jgi:hypothetical protein
MPQQRQLVRRSRAARRTEEPLVAVPLEPVSSTEDAAELVARIGALLQQA